MYKSKNDFQRHDEKKSGWRLLWALGCFVASLMATGTVSAERLGATTWPALLRDPFELLPLALASAGLSGEALRAATEESYAQWLLSVLACSIWLLWRRELPTAHVPRWHPRVF